MLMGRRRTPPPRNASLLQREAKKIFQREGKDGHHEEVKGKIDPVQMVITRKGRPMVNEKIRFLDPKEVQREAKRERMEEPTFLITGTKVERDDMVEWWVQH